MLPARRPSVRPPAAKRVTVETGVAYREAHGWSPALNTLDVYRAPAAGRLERRPVVVFLHGGNWRGGDKSALPGAPEGGLPAWFVERGFVFVAPNFRLHGRDGATVAEMADDIAKALKWLTVNVRKFGGASSGFVLVGHSSGAHLAALVATDPSRLGAHRLTPAVVAGVACLDVPFYDVPAAMAVLGERAGDGEQALQRFEAAREVMGATEADQARVSPAAHLGPWMGHVRFLLVSAGVHGGRTQALSRAMSENFARRLKAMQVAVRHEHFPGLDHMRVLEDFEGRPASAVAEFLRALARPSG